MTRLENHPMWGYSTAPPTSPSDSPWDYRDAVAAGDSVLHPLGHPAVGHEFHRTTVEFTAAYPPAWSFVVGGIAKHDGAIRNKVHAAYLHTHPGPTRRGAQFRRERRACSGRPAMPMSNT